MKNIVIIGGGTGTFTLLSGLRKFPSNNTVIVASSDDGGSTGRLRKELGVFPPGDIRQCLVGLSYEKISGSINIAISQIAKILNVRGQVLPVTLFPTILSAIYKNGKKVIGEHNIDEPSPQKIIKSGIKSLKLFPNSPANPKAVAAIKNADAIIFGPGDLFTSTVPNLLVKGIKEALTASKAKKILITNIVTKDGQTNNFKASDFAKVLNQYLLLNANQKGLDAAVINTKKPDKKVFLAYKQHKAQFVEPDAGNLNKMGLKVIAAQLVSNYIHQKNGADKLKRSFLRHNAEKTAKIIWELIS
jgi:uncharacterized cofD-like protein